MGLTQCPDCGEKVSTEATACPHCGRPGKPAKVKPAPPTKPQKRSSRGWLWMLLGVVVLIVLGQLYGGENERSSKPPSSSVRDEHPAPKPRTLLDELESSEVFARHRLEKKKHWSLTSGGENFSYTFPDEESGDGIGLEVGPSANNITTVGISWYGESTDRPARLTAAREQFLRDMLSVIFPDIDRDAVVKVTRSEQSKDYPEGSDAMPRHTVGGYKVYVGTVASSLIVGVDK